MPRQMKVRIVLAFSNILSTLPAFACEHLWTSTPMSLYSSTPAGTLPFIAYILALLTSPNATHSIFWVKFHLPLLRPLYQLININVQLMSASLIIYNRELLPPSIPSSAAPSSDLCVSVVLHHFCTCNGVWCWYAAEKKFCRLAIHCRTWMIVLAGQGGIDRVVFCPEYGYQEQGYVCLRCDLHSCDHFDQLLHILCSYPCFFQSQFLINYSNFLWNLRLFSNWQYINQGDGGRE